jgi:AcrR family transcriptional regulator
VLCYAVKVSPRLADPAVRAALIEAAARIVATEGRGALTLRRLAKEVGTSTMAVYTHFGSMDDLRREVRMEGFARLRCRLASVKETSDPVADLTLLGAAYYLSATASPNLYRAMFLDGPVDESDLGTGLDTFMYLVKGMARCLEHGRFPKAGGAEPADLALDLWAITHGLVSLQLANLLSADQVAEHITSAGRSLFLAWGDEPDRLRVSAGKAKKRLGTVAAARSR